MYADPSPTMNATLTCHYSSLDDDSLRTERTFENAPMTTNRVKHLALNKRHSVYKNLMADVSQVTDGRSMELLRRDLNESFPMIGSETKAVPTKDRGDSSRSSKRREFRRSNSDGVAHLDNVKTKSDAGSRRLSHDMPAAIMPTMPREESVQQRPLTTCCDKYLPVLSNEAQPCESSYEGSRQPIDSLSSPFSEEDRSSANTKDDDHDNSTGSLNFGDGNHGADKKVKNATIRRPSVENSAAPFNSDPSLLSTLNSGSSVSAKSASETKVSLRQKHQPHHRCPSINGLVIGIVKPSSYSPGNSSQATATSSSDTILASTSPPDQPRRAFRIRSTLPVSLKQLSGSFFQLKPGEITKLKNLRDIISSSSLGDTEKTPVGTKNSTKKECTIDTSTRSSLNLSMHSNQSWVPSGVNFSAKMEVYVFET
mmetsp:Transcript_3021/g.6614  ORF Transcript_3021/g.6614 Transcript_3021/m.6614 type:complete len:425 (+) Transcript_3021:65-1339(+)